MARGMGVKERAACFVHHYRRLYAELPDGFLRRLLVGEVPLLELPGNDCRYSIAMGFSSFWDKEGELSLNLRVDGRLIHVLSFSIVPGWVVAMILCACWRVRLLALSPFERAVGMVRPACVVHCG
jgi:uncharacterized protein VirK/YbjX